MNTFLKKWRKKNLNKANIGKYLLYAIGEILLITIGVLIAVNINDNVTEKKNSVLRCQFLEELNYTFEEDMKDVADNILGLSYWNPRIKEIVAAGVNNRKLNEIDSLNEKLALISNFIFFGQRTKTKMEELKYSPVDLVGNRALKNKLLLYQDYHIMFLQNTEKRYNLIDEEMRQYFAKNFFGYHYFKEVIPYDVEKLENDKYFISLTYQKYMYNEYLKDTYIKIQNEQKEIKALIEKEITKNCNTKNQNN